MEFKKKIYYKKDHDKLNNALPDSDKSTDIERDRDESDNALSNSDVLSSQNDHDELSNALYNFNTSTSHTPYTSKKPIPQMDEDTTEGNLALVRTVDEAATRYFYENTVSLIEYFNNSQDDIIITYFVIQMMHGITNIVLISSNGSSNGYYY